MVRSFFTHVETAGSQRVFEMICGCVVVAISVPTANAGADDEAVVTADAIAIWAVDWNT